MCTTKRNLSLIIVLLAGSSTMFAMDPANARKRREQQAAAQKKYQQEQIDRKMKEDIKNAGPAKIVQTNPNASFPVRLAATSHNTTARHNQTMQNLKKK